MTTALTSAFRTFKKFLNGAYPNNPTARFGVFLVGLTLIILGISGVIFNPLVISHIKINEGIFNCILVLLLGIIELLVGSIILKNLFKKRDK